MQADAEYLETKAFYEFDRFRVDPVNRLLLCNGEVVPLTSKVFDILLIFVQNSGRLLEKDELMRRVWQGSFVEEGNLTRNVSTLRKALGEDPKVPQYIVTVPGRGYKFVASIRQVREIAPQIIIEERTVSTTLIEEEIHLADEAPAARALRDSGEDIRTRRRLRRILLTAAVSLLGLLIVIALNPAVLKGLWRESNAKKSPIADASPQFVKFTSTGTILFGSISPDGKFAAYISSEADKGQSILIKQVATGSSLCVLPAATDVSYWGLTFSPDSNLLYYVVEHAAHLGRGVLYRLPVVGGTPQKLLTNIATHPSFSPDGNQMIYKHTLPNKTELILADVDGRNQQVWATSSSIYDYWAYSWSPNGQTIAYANSRADEGGRYWYIAEMPVTGGKERAITERRFRAIRGLSWVPDGRSLVVVAEEPTTGLFQLWNLSADDGTERRLTNDVNDYWRVSLTADGSALLTSQQERPAKISIASMSDPHRTLEITDPAGFDTLAWTPDNRLTYSLLDNGRYDIWTMEPDGSGQKRLTANAGNNKFPAVSADGQYLFFVSNRDGRYEVWRMERDGSEAKQIGGEATGRVQCSPDGKWAFYSSDAQGRWALWRVPLEGGEPEKIRDLYFYRASISPDGKLLAYTYLDEESGRVRLAISAMDNDTPIRTFDADIGYEVIRWVDGGNEVAYISGDHQIRVQPITGGQPRLLLTVPDELFSFDISRDRTKIAYISGRVTNNLVLIRNFWKSE